MSRFKAILPVLLIVIAAAGLLYFGKTQLRSGTGASGAAAEGTMGELELGALIPDLMIRFLDGKEVSLSKLEKKVTLINFWATWCEACLTEMPSLIKLYKEYSPKGFEVIAISVDEEPKNVVPEFQKKFGMTFPIATDTDQAWSDQFNVRAIPMTIVIDKDRKVLHIENGDRDWNDDEMRAKMDAWLKAS
jgi:peroxiredoxin